MTPHGNFLARRGIGVPTAAALLLLAASSAAQAVDLIDVYRRALSSDPVFRGAAAANRAAQEARPQARAELLPSIEAGAEAAEVFFKDDSGSEHFFSNEISLRLSQPIFRRDRWVALNQADSRIQQADAEFAFALQDLMLRASTRYFDVLRAEDELSFARAERDAFEQQLRQSRQRFEVGLIAITDVEEAQAGFDLAKAQVIAAENELDVAREALREVTGEYHLELSGLSERINLVSPTPDDIDQWTQVALTQNYELLAARYAAEVARDEIRLAQAGHFPTLDFVGAYAKDSSGGVSRSRETVDDASVAVELNVPLFSGGGVVSRTRERRHLYDGALEEVETRRRAAHRRTREAYLGVTAGISRVMALEQAVKSTEAARAAIEAGFQVGTRTSVDVLDAERDVFRAKRDLAAARYDYIIDTLTLKQAAGTLSQEDLGVINAWLQ